MEAALINHSDRFDCDERMLAVGVKARVVSAVTFLDSRIVRLQGIRGALHLKPGAASVCTDLCADFS